MPPFPSGTNTRAARPAVLCPGVAHRLQQSGLCLGSERRFERLCAEILQDSGKVSALEARLKAEGEYEVYRQRQDVEYLSDFDREIKRIEGKKS